MKTYACSIAVALILTGCATQKVMIPIDGSKAHGTVDLAFEYGAFEVPQVDPIASLATARQRCAAWGYGNAEAFGGSLQQCVATDFYGNCVRMRVTAKYQCVD